MLWWWRCWRLRRNPPPLPHPPNLLSRVAEEAEVFEQNIPKTLTTETLEQRTLLPPSRFRPRIGRNAIEQAAKPRLRVRQIISEYSVGALQESPSHDLTEFRQVISVDGRKVQSDESARHALSIGLKDPDDRARKRMLEDFARHGLVDVATDYGLILLTFSKRGQRADVLHPRGRPANRRRPRGRPRLAADLRHDGMLEFIGNQATRRAMRGRLLVRKSDGLPSASRSGPSTPSTAADPRRSHRRLRPSRPTASSLPPASSHRHL